MNRIPVVLFLAAISVGIGGGCRNAQPREKIIMARFDAMNRHDVSGLRSFYADSVRGESTGWNSVIAGAPEVCKAYERYFNSSPDLRYRVTRILESGNSAVVEYTSEGTLLQNEPGVPEYMRGKHYVLKNCTLFDFQNDKIVRESTYFDQVSFLRQVGYFGEHGNGQ